jgi:hypothetical protein
VLQFFRERSVALNFYRHDPKRVQRIERVMQVEELLGESLNRMHLTYQSRIRAYRLDAERRQHALEVAQDTLKRLPKDHRCCSLISETSWLLRERKQYALAQELLRGYLTGTAGTDVFLQPLLVEQARVQAACGQKPAAEQSLTAFLASAYATAADNNTLVAEAWLMLGFLREERGDPGGAAEAWKKAYLGYARELGPGNAGAITGFRFMNYLIAGGLSGLLADRDVETVVGRLLVQYGTEALVHLLRSSGIVHPTVLRDCWKSPRGKLWARRLAFQEVTFPQFLQVPPMLFGLELARRDAFGGAMTAEQEELVWQIGREGMEGVMGGTIKESAVFGLAASWKGVTNFLGWGGVRGALAPTLRGPLAYVLGHRFLRRNNLNEARSLFEQARAEATPDSALRRLAQAELDRLRMK